MPDPDAPEVFDTGHTMPAVEAQLAEVHPALLESRASLGLDHFDEMWDGVLHMNPPPRGWHQMMATRLLLTIGPAASQLGLHCAAEIALYRDHDDYRTPDVAVFARTSGSSSASPARCSSSRCCPLATAAATSSSGPSSGVWPTSCSSTPTPSPSRCSMLRLPARCRPRRTATARITLTGLPMRIGRADRDGIGVLRLDLPDGSVVDIEPDVPLTQR